MSHAPRLELRQSQSLVMTAQLQQSIKLLQLSSLDLHAFIAQELEKNPLLAEDEDGGEGETAGGGDEPPPASDAGATLQSDAPAPEIDKANWETASQEESAWQEDGASSDNAEFADPGAAYQMMSSTGGGTLSGDDIPAVERARSREATLQSHLLGQLGIETRDPALRAIVAQMIDMLDDAGYFKDDLAALAEKLGATAAQAEQALALLQSFDPPGIGARSLSECLALQLRERDRFDPAMQMLLDHLPLLAEGAGERLMKLCGVDAEDLRQMVAEIRSLNPKPAGSFDREDAETVEPDVLLRRLPDGGWHVELAPAALPRVLVNRQYYAQVSGSARNATDKKYLTDQLAHANWLVRALDSRAKTLLKVASEIVTRQDAFFRMGIQHLKPLTLREVAQATGFHESTVSRVTTHKYIATARGVYELKYFFTSSLQNAAGGDDFSSATVKHLIQGIIGRETPDAILSDDDIAEKLRASNINVARRTVAKYREALGIGSSTERRRKNKREF